MQSTHPQRFSYMRPLVYIQHATCSNTCSFGASWKLFMKINIYKTINHSAVKFATNTHTHFYSHKHTHNIYIYICTHTPTYNTASSPSSNLLAWRPSYTYILLLLLHDRTFCHSAVNDKRALIMFLLALLMLLIDSYDLPLAVSCHSYEFFKNQKSPCFFRIFPHVWG